MLINIHSHTSETAEGILAIRSFCITQGPIATSGTVSIGLHPWSSPTPLWYESLLQAASQPQCLMIGECGLDKCHGAPMPIQIERFRLQIMASEQLGKPLIIHAVHTLNEIIQLKKEFRPAQPWILHGFSGSPQMARQLLQHDIIPSFGAVILHQSKAQESLLAVGPGRFFLETDESPITIATIYQTAARILHTDPAAIESSISHLFATHINYR